jgi:small ligand-binding sensory domain FIST
VKWASAVARGAGLEETLSAAAARAMGALDTAKADLVVAFVSPHFSDEYDRIPAMIRSELGGGMLVGCSAGGVIGGGSEVEDAPAVSLTVASLPGVEITPFHVDGQAIPEPGDRAGWKAVVRRPLEDEPSLVLLPDPFSCPAERMLTSLDAAYPNSAKIGGLASGAQRPGGNRLYLGPNAYAGGAVGVALSGNLAVDAVVAQGCRPIGEPMFITGCRDNLLLELDGRPAVDVLKDLFEGLSVPDREIFRHSLFVGLVMNERRQRYGHGDFLVRNLLGLSEEPRALAIGAMLHENLVVQFHLRDRETSAEDLRAMLARYVSEAGSRGPSGALLFSCLGRGTGLYGERDHDSRVFRERVGEVPLGGFFCNGEIGQVHGRTFLHGYTSAFGMFRARDDA